MARATGIGREPAKAPAGAAFYADSVQSGWSRSSRARLEGVPFAFGTDLDGVTFPVRGHRRLDVHSLALGGRARIGNEFGGCLVFGGQVDVAVQLKLRLERLHLPQRFQRLA